MFEIILEWPATSGGITPFDMMFECQICQDDLPLYVSQTFQQMSDSKYVSFCFHLS